MTGQLSTGARRARLAAFTCVVALASGVAAAVLSSTSGLRAWLFVSLLVAPLLAPLPGILRGTRRTYAWATLCLTPYFLYGITESVANPRARAAAAIVLLASLALFAALVAFLRLTRAAAAPIQRD